MIIAFAEQHNGKLKKVAFEALSAAHTLAHKLNTSAGAVIVGANVTDLTGEISRFGISKVFLIDAPELAGYTPDGYADVIARLAKQEQPQVLILSATSIGRDLAPKLAARLNASLLQDCIALETDDQNRIIGTRPVYAGKALVRVVAENARLAIATIRPRAFSVAGQDAQRPEVVTTDFRPEAVRAKLMEVITAQTGTVDLSEADVVVSGGRALKGPEGFRILEELAQVLGAAVGASRAAVDAGWRDHQAQVGQTGRTVAPALYVACGISGAIQHLVGMIGSRCIVAINKDKDANIFKVADYGIVGDVFEVIPLLTQELKKALKE